MVLDPTADRRTVLKAVGVAGALGAAGVAGGRPPQHGVDELRLFGEAAADDAREVVTQGNYAYVATNDGMAVVDWHNPTRPERVAKIVASDPEDIGGDDEGSVGGVLDVKVDGDLAAMAHNGGTGITTVDVSDPADPEELAFYNTQDDEDVHNCFLYEDHAYLTVSGHRTVEDGIRIFGDAGVEIVDVSDPTDPEQASLWRLRDELPAYANAGVNPNHDLYVQDDLVYNAFWDAGVVVLDASDPSDPEFVTQFGAAPNADEEVPPYRGQENYFSDIFPLDRYYAGEGNAHYVQPSPDGDLVFVGDEKFPGRLEEDPDTEQFGGVRIFDASDLSDVEQVGFVSPPDIDEGLRTAHNFDVTANRLHASWYHGGVRVYDVTDPDDPAELAAYNPEGYAFWTAERARGFTVGGIYGARSGDAHVGGVSILHDDRGERGAPSFEGAAAPSGPEVEPAVDDE